MTTFTKRDQSSLWIHIWRVSVRSKGFCVILYINANIPAHKEARENFSLIDYCHYLILCMKEVLIYPIKGIYFILPTTKWQYFWSTQEAIRIFTHNKQRTYGKVFYLCKKSLFAFPKGYWKKDINQYLWHINFKIDLTAVHCTKFFPLFFY